MLELILFSAKILDTGSYSLTSRMFEALSIYLDINLSFTFDNLNDDSKLEGDLSEKDSLSSLCKESRIVLSPPEERRLIDNFMADSSSSKSFPKLMDSLNPFLADLILSSLYELIFLTDLGVIIAGYLLL